MPAAALPELREAEAPLDIAAIYAALRRASGVPLVNLIHRHLATLPGVLPWVWQAIRPPLEDGPQRDPAGVVADDAVEGVEHAQRRAVLLTRRERSGESEP